MKYPAASAITHDNKCRIIRIFCSLPFLQLVDFFSNREAAWKILLFVAVVKYAGSACLKKQKPWQECWLPWQSKQSRALGCCEFYHKDKKCVLDGRIADIIIMMQQIQSSLQDLFFILCYLRMEGGSLSPSGKFL